jgi:hypothetical protein
MATIRAAKQKVFSATPLRQDGELKGYLYIILQGEESNALAEMAWHKALWSTVLWSLLLVALFGLLAGLLVWYWVTRPVKRLTWRSPGWSRTASAPSNSWRHSRRTRGK